MADTTNYILKAWKALASGLGIQVGGTAVSGVNPLPISSFKAFENSTVIVALNSSSGATRKQFYASTPGAIRVRNKGSVDAYFVTGSNVAGTAATVPTASVAGSQGISAGATETFRPNGNYMAGVTATGTSADLEVTPGEGI